MGKIVNGYKYVKGFLTPEELKLLIEYTKIYCLNKKNIYFFFKLCFLTKIQNLN